LARRFDKSASWVSRRLSLVSDLPQQIQQLKGVTVQLLPCERDEVHRCLRQARADSEQLFDRFSKENLA